MSILMPINITLFCLLYHLIRFEIAKIQDSSVGKESACRAGDPGSIPGLGRFPWRREWLPTPVFLPGEFPDRRAWQATVHGITMSQT